MKMKFKRGDIIAVDNGTSVPFVAIFKECIDGDFYASFCYSRGAIGGYMDGYIHHANLSKARYATDAEKQRMYSDMESANVYLDTTDWKIKNTYRYNAIKRQYEFLNKETNKFE